MRNVGVHVDAGRRPKARSTCLPVTAAAGVRAGQRGRPAGGDEMAETSKMLFDESDHQFSSYSTYSVRQGLAEQLLSND